MKSAGRRSLAWAVSMVPALVLALLSSLLTHQIAYLATQPLEHDGHTHVAWRWALLLPLLLLGISWAVVRHLREHGHRRVSTAGVATLGLLLFLGQETVEIIRAGGSAPQAIRSPGVLAGALLLAPIAAVLVRCLCGVAGLVQRLFGPPDARPLRRDDLPRAGAVEVFVTSVVAMVLSRGPPVGIAPSSRPLH